MFLEFDFVGGPSYKNTPILTFDFDPPPDPGVHLEPSGCVGSKSCIKPKATDARF